MNDAADQDKPLPPAADDAEAPAPKRRRSPAKAMAEAAAPDTAAQAPVPVKRARRKAEATVEAPEAEAAVAPVAAAPADEEAPAPARKRAPRKSAALEEAAPAPVAAEAPAPASEPAPAPAPIFTLGAEVPAAAAGEGGEADEDGDGEGEDGERGSRSRNRRRNRKERAERDGGAPEAGGQGDKPASPLLAPELVEAAGARFADVLSGSLDAESEAPDVAPPVTATAPAPEGSEGGEAAEGDTKRVLAADADAPKLQKVLAQAGIGSRRDIEDWIADGKIEVNGEVAHVGQRISFGDRVRVNGKEVRVRISPPNPRILAYHKPTGEVSTFNDPEGRPTISKLLGQESQKKVTGEHSRMPRLYPVGRLDYLSEGLLLMTNDGELANRLSKASTGVEKTYLVKVSGKPTDQAIDQLRRGIMIDRGRLNEVRGQGAAARRDRVLTQPAKIEQVRSGDNPWFEVTLTEGRNRQLRKMFEEIGHHVEKIRRIGYGALQLDVPPGGFRELTTGEVQALSRAAAGKKVERKKVMPEHAQLKKPVPPRRKPGVRRSV